MKEGKKIRRGRERRMDRNDGGNAQCTIDVHSIRSVSTHEIRLHSGGEGDLPDPNDIVRVSGEQRLPVGRPSQGNTLRRLGLAGSQHFRLQLVYDHFALQIPDLHRRSCETKQ